MYESSFDQAGGELRPFDRRLLWALRLIAVLAVVAATSAGAQIPNSPVLQNAWATPGVSGAINITGGSDGSVYAGAGSYALTSGKIQLSGGLGYGTRTGGGTSMASYGLRIALPLGGDASTFGFAPFVGLCGCSNQTTYHTVTFRGVILDTLADSTTSSMQFPIGVGFGWRRAGGGRGFSVYGTPSVVFYTGGTASGALFRAAVGGDFAASRNIGITGGIEFGATRGRGVGGPSGTLYGFGVSYAFGHR
jgi:hypothetical protein